MMRMHMQVHARIRPRSTEASAPQVLSFSMQLLCYDQSGLNTGRASARHLWFGRSKETVQTTALQFNLALLLSEASETELDHEIL